MGNNFDTYIGIYFYINILGIFIYVYIGIWGGILFSHQHRVNYFQIEVGLFFYWYNRYYFYSIIRVCIYHNIRGIFIYTYIGMRGGYYFCSSKWVLFLKMMSGLSFYYMIGYLFYHDTRDIFIKRLRVFFLSLMGINFIVINGVKFITNVRGYFITRYWVLFLY